MDTNHGSSAEVSAGEDKAVLRQKFRNLRRKFKAGGGRAATQAFQNHLQKIIRDFDQPDLQVCLYRPRRDEAPCSLAPVTRFFYPVLRGDELEFRRPSDEKAFQTNALAFEEPIIEQSTALDPAKPIAVFCPAVAIDSQGIRLGLGKGYYDRFFSSHPEALRIGLVFHVQISSQPLPADSWDQAMDWIVSEKMILRVSNSSGSARPKNQRSL